jgi:hypothetical protein
MKSMTPEHSPAPRVTLLADHQILDLLADLRTRAGDDTMTDHSIVIPAIAELEVEVARRNLDAPSVHEWIPAVVALDRFRTALALDDVQAAARTRRADGEGDASANRMLTQAASTRPGGSSRHQPALRNAAEVLRRGHDP